MLKIYCPDCEQEMTKITYFIPKRNVEKVKDKEIFNKPRTKYICGYCEILCSNHKNYNDRHYTIPDILKPTEKQTNTIYFINSRLHGGLRPLTKRQCSRDIDKYLKIATDETKTSLTEDSIRLK
jgi:hypothetical protein